MMLVDVQTISIVIAATSVVIGVINSIMSNRRAEKQRQMQLFTDIYSHFLHEDFTKNWDHLMYVSKWDNFQEMMEQATSQTDREPIIAFAHAARLIAYVCVGINRGFIDLDIVDDLIANRIIEYWEKYRFYHVAVREHAQDPTLGDDIEAAYNLLKPRRQQRIALAQQAVISS
jgi:hypothetical protein